MPQGSSMPRDAVGMAWSWPWPHRPWTLRPSWRRSPTRPSPTDHAAERGAACQSSLSTSRPKRMACVSGSSAISARRSAE